MKMLLLRVEGREAGKWLGRDLLLLVAVDPNVLVKVVAS
jgi:hypothetical protein